MEFSTVSSRFSRWSFRHFTDSILDKPVSPSCRASLVLSLPFQLTSPTCASIWYLTTSRTGSENKSIGLSPPFSDPSCYRLGCSCLHGLRIQTFIGRYLLLEWGFSALGIFSPCNHSSSTFHF